MYLVGIPKAHPDAYGSARRKKVSAKIEILDSRVIASKNSSDNIKVTFNYPDTIQLFHPLKTAGLFLYFKVFTTAIQYVFQY